MNVSEYDIVRFIKANPGDYTCTLNGVEVQIYVDAEDTLRVLNTFGYFRSTTTSHPEFVHNDRGDKTTSEVVFEEALIRKIKDELLRKKITHELKAMLTAATAMIEHYSVYNAGDEFRTPAETYIRMYWLKDIDFEQSGKGTVVIVPNSTGSQDDGNYIKGYIYHDDHASIKFEGVQAWRYKRVEAIDIFNLGAQRVDEWNKLLARPK